MPEPARLLVLCTANVCRSPLGAALVDRMATEHLPPEAAIDVVSAGTRARPGHQVAAETARIARRWHTDLSEHRARPMTCELVESADLVLTMEDSHRMAALHLVPAALPRTFTWLELARLAREVDAVEAAAGSADRLASLARAAHRARPWAPAPTAREDVADPMGRSARDFRRMATTLVDSASVFLPLLLLERPLDRA